MAIRNVRIIPKRTAVPGRIPTGTTGNENNFIQQGELALNTADRKLYSFDGSNVFEIGFYNFSGGNISGNFSAPNITATTAFYSGSTELGQILSDFVPFEYIGPNDFYFESVSGNSSAAFTVSRAVPDITFMINGESGSTEVNVSEYAGFVVNHVSHSGTNQFQMYLNGDGFLLERAQGSGGLFDIRVNSKFSSNLSAVTYYSGSTLIDSLFARTSHTHAISDVNTLSTHLGNKVNISGATFVGNIYAPIISGGTLYSGSTDLGQIISSLAGGSNFTGGTVSNGTNFTGGLSSSTIYSGTTLLDSLFSRTSHTHTISDVNTLLTHLVNKADLSGSTFTGAVSGTTAAFVGDILLNGNFGLVGKVNNVIRSAVTFHNATNAIQFGNNNANVSYVGAIALVTPTNLEIRNSAALNISKYFGTTGNWTFGGNVDSGIKVDVQGNMRVTGSTTATTYYSGSTLLDSLFARASHIHAISEVNTLSTHLGNKADLSGSTFIGNIYAPVVSGGTLYSGGTDLGQIISSLAGGSSFTGGTVSNGANFTGGLSATTIYSGNTLLDSLFARAVHTHSVSEIDTLATHLGNKADLSGATFTGAVSGTTAAFTGDIMINGNQGLVGKVNNVIRSAVTFNNASNLMTFGNFGANVNYMGGGTVFAVATSLDIRNNSGLNNTRYTPTTGNWTFGGNVDSGIKVDVQGNMRVTGSTTATTYYSGTTLLDSLFARTSHTHAVSDVSTLSTHLGNKSDLSGATFTGNIYVPVVSGGTLYSGSTDLGQIISSLAGSSSFTGGTVSNGANFTGGFSATTIYSGSTDVSNLFARISHTHAISDVTNLQSSLDEKSNTGHTHLLTDVNTLSTHLGNKSDLSGATFTGAVSGTTAAFAGDIMLNGNFALVGKANNSIRSAVTFNNSTNAILFGSNSTNTSYIGAVALVTPTALEIRNSSALNITKYFGTTGNWTFGGVVDSGIKVDVQGNFRVTGSTSATTYYSGSTLLDSLFARTVHIHSISDVTNLQSSLDGKSNTGHTHALADVTNLQSSLDGKSNTGHTHLLIDVDTLSTHLGNKTDLSGATFIGNVYVPIITGDTLYSGGTLIDSLFARAVHTHTISDVANLQSSLDGKSNTGHTHLLTDVDTLSTHLGNKTDLSGATFTGNIYVPTVSGGTLYSGSTDVSNLFAKLSHTHVISDVTNLQSSLDGKSNTGHTHTLADVNTLTTHLGNKADLSGSTFTGAVSGTTAAFVGDIMLNGNFGLIGKANNIIRSAVTFNNSSNLITFGNLSTNVNYLGGGTVFAVATSLDIRNNSGLNSTRYTPTTGNWTFGGTVDSGIKVDVQGNMRVTGSTTATTYYSGTTSLSDIFDRYTPLEYIEFSLLETVSSAATSFWYRTDMSGVTNGKRSLDVANGISTNSVNPWLVPFTGRIIGAVIYAKGLGAAHASPTGPFTYRCDVYNNTTTSTLIDTANFSFSAGTTVGSSGSSVSSYAFSEYTFASPVTIGLGMNIGLRFVPGSGASGIAYQEGVRVVLKFQKLL